MLLLPRVNYVPFFQDLHGKGFVFIALELNLQTGIKDRQPLNSFGFFFLLLNRLMSPSHLSATYQLDPPKASNSQSVDDVEVGQIKAEEKRILSFVPVTPEKEGKCGNRIKDDVADKRQNNPLSTS